MQGRSSKDWNSRLVAIATGVLGVSAVMTQLALMRELLASFCGNELVLGVILGNWMLLTGLGAALGRAAHRLRDPALALIVAMLLVAILPPAQVVCLRVFRDVIFIRGALVGVAETFAASLALLAPYCLVSGCVLTLACRLMAERDAERGIGRVYFADSIGSIIGGLLFTFVLVRWFDHFALLCVPAFLSLGTAAALSVRFKRRSLCGISVALAMALIASITQVDVDAVSTAKQYPGQKILFRGNSPYGRLIVTDVAGQLNFIENGVPLFSTRNEAHVEETIHYAMAQRPDARKVLLVSGGVSGTAREILKYAGVVCTYVELDPLIIGAGSRFLPGNLDDPRIRIVKSDGRLFIKQTEERFDVVIIDVPDPSTAQINRFFTAEFYGEVKGVLSQGGVLSFALGQYASYVSPQLAQMLACANETLRRTFRQTLMIPGGRIFILASDGELTTAVASRIAEAGIATEWVRQSYLDAMLAPDRLADLARAAHQPAPVNRDFNPVLYFRHLVYWTSQFTSRWTVVAAVMAIALAVYSVRLRAVPFTIFASGFAASGLELVLLVGFQILCGSLYHQIGVIVAAFMAGLAAGAFVANRFGVASHRRLAGLAFAIAIFAAALPFVLTTAGRLVTSLAAIQIIIAIMTFAMAVLVGMEFPVASRLDGGNASQIAARLYSADFVGAFLGALLPGVLVFPLLGVGAACWLTAGVNAAAGVLVLVRKGDRS